MTVRGTQGKVVFKPAVTQDPFALSKQADAKQQLQNVTALVESQVLNQEGNATLENVSALIGQGVLNAEGEFPYGEGYLYDDYDGNDLVASPAPSDTGVGVSEIGTSDHKGTREEQWDAHASKTMTVKGQNIGIAAIADGASYSESLAKPAAEMAVTTFNETLETLLANLPEEPEKRHGFMEQAIAFSAAVANEKVIDEVLLSGYPLPPGITKAQAMQMLAQHDITAHTTFTATVAVGSDLYTFNSGDSVAGLYRPSQPVGERFIHLTDRRNAVVDSLVSGQQLDPNLGANVLTDALGDETELTGTVRSYLGVLKPGDKVVLMPDSPRGQSAGGRPDGELGRETIESVLNTNTTAQGAANGLVAAHLVGSSEPGVYQDNVTSVVMNIDDVVE